MTLQFASDDAVQSHATMSVAWTSDSDCRSRMIAPEDVVWRWRVADNPVTNAKVVADRRRSRIVTSKTRSSVVVLQPAQQRRPRLQKLNNHAPSTFYTLTQNLCVKLHAAFKRQLKTFLFDCAFN